MTIRYFVDEMDTPDRTSVMLRKTGDEKPAATFIPAEVARKDEIELTSIHAYVRYRGADGSTSPGSTGSTRPFPK